MLQARQIDQCACPGDQVRDEREGSDNHPDKKEGQIGEARFVSGRQGTSNEARDDQARANWGQHDAEDEKDTDHSFRHRMAPIKAIV
jgi:hypothetical protein